MLRTGNMQHETNTTNNSSIRKPLTQNKISWKQFKGQADYHQQPSRDMYVKVILTHVQSKSSKPITWLTY